MLCVKVVIGVVVFVGGEEGGRAGRGRKGEGGERIRGTRGANLFSVTQARVEMLISIFQGISSAPKLPL